MAAANRRRHEGVELALGRGRVVPGMVDIERYQDRAIACQPRPPARQIALHVDIGGDLPRRRRGVEYVLVVLIHVGLDMEGQQPLRHRAVSAQDVQRGLQAGAGAFDHRFRPGGEFVGLLRRHPGKPRRQFRRLAEPAGLDEMITGDAVSRTPADAGAGRFLIADIPPGLSKIDAGGRRQRSGHRSGGDDVGRRPVGFGIARGHHITNAMRLRPCGG